MEKVTFQWDTSTYIALVLQEWLHEVSEQQDEPLHQRRLEESTSQGIVVPYLKKSIGIVVPYLKKSIGKDSITFSNPKSYVLKSMPSLIPKSISC